MFNRLPQRYIKYILMFIFTVILMLLVFGMAILAHFIGDTTMTTSMDAASNLILSAYIIITAMTLLSDSLDL